MSPTIALVLLRAWWRRFVKRHICDYDPYDAETQAWAAVLASGGRLP